MIFESGAEGEHLSLPGNDCAAPKQDGCRWQAGGIHTGVCFWLCVIGQQIGEGLNLLQTF